jgi:CO/xanthine dehydrogenase FAD-binding subunit
VEYLVINKIEEINECIPDKGVLRYLAGGTDLMYRIKKGLLKTENLTLVDIRGVDSLKGIVLEEGSLRIGALTTISELREFLFKEKVLPFLSHALSHIASPQIRNMATIGGHCGGCYPNSHLLPALMTYDTTITVSHYGEGQILQVQDLFASLYHNRLEKGSLIEDVRIPLESLDPSFYWGGGGRASFSFAPLVLVLAAKADGSYRAIGGGKAFLPTRFPLIERFLEKGLIPDEQDLSAVLGDQAEELTKSGIEFSEYDLTLLHRFIKEFIQGESRI